MCVNDHVLSLATGGTLWLPKTGTLQITDHSKRDLQRKRTVTIKNNRDENSLMPKEALSLLSDNAYIIVENSNSDQVFVKSMAKALGETEILEAIEQGWIEFDSEGGKGGIIRRINHHLAKPFKPRILVLVDSDRHFPGDNHKSENICQHCTNKDVNHFVLHKRAIENYIPEAAFERLPNNLKNVIDAYKSLTDDQKDYYDLKKGFDGKGKLPASQEALFNGIDHKDPIFNALRNGFSVNKFNPNDVHTLLNSELITKQSLLNRCSTNPKELTAILDSIINLI